MTEQHPSPLAADLPGFGDPGFQIYNQLLSNRIVFLGTDVNDIIPESLGAAASPHIVPRAP